MAGGAENESTNESSSQQYVFKEQEPFLLDVYAESQAVANKQEDAGRIARRQIKPFDEANQQALGGLNYVSDFNQGIINGSNLGVNTLQNAGTNPFTQGQLDSAGWNINRDLTRRTLPGIRDQGNASNPYGGGSTRQQLFEGMALSDANQQYSDAASSIIGQNYLQDTTQRLGAAQGYIDAGLGAAQANTALADSFRQGTQGLVNLGLSPEQARWIPLQNYAQAVNRPVVLGESSGSGFSTSSKYGGNY